MSVILEDTCCLNCGSNECTVYTSTQTMMSTDTSTWTFVSCDHCNLVYLTPRVPSQGLAPYYDHTYLPYRGPTAWGRFAELVKGDLAKIDKKRVEIVRRVMNSSSPAILDIGCGKPSFLQLAKKELRGTCTGIDFTDHGWKSDVEAYSDLELIVSEPQDFNSSQTYDVVTMWHYLEHDYQPLTTLKNIKRMLAPDGVVIIEVPDVEGSTADKYKEHWAGYHTPRHTALYTISTLTDMLVHAGYTVVTANRFGTLDAYTLDWMSRMEKEKLDWTREMESEFWKFVLGKLRRPWFFGSQEGQGFMHIIAKPS